MLGRLLAAVRSCGSESSDEDGRDEGAVWDLIPGRQYDGRYADSGGLTRGEQERSFREIDERGEAIEAADADRPPEE